MIQLHDAIDVFGYFTLSLTFIILPVLSEW